MLKLALLVLTLTNDGAVRVTLSESESAGDCRTSQEMITTILSEAGVEVIAARCGETELVLTPFEHGATAEEEVHRYKVTLGAAGGFGIVPLAAGEACTPLGRGGRNGLLHPLLASGCGGVTGYPPAAGPGDMQSAAGLFSPAAA